MTTTTRQPMTFATCTEIEVWDKAEDALRNVLDDYATRSGKKWRLNEGDGAFYGPKIDIHVYDAMRRSHQCLSPLATFIFVVTILF
jgi:threonyl-tRNA synthetase